MKLALLGNPNSGKSTLFNQLTGLNQKTGNYPGVTVEKRQGKARFGDTDMTVMDLPGAYSLYPNAEDERVVLNILANPKDEDYPEVVLYVADSTHLERHLLMLTQIKDLNLPMVLALNMVDEAKAQGLVLDIAGLSQSLGIPVVCISAKTGEGVQEAKELLLNEHAHYNRKAFKAFYSITDNERKVTQAILDRFDMRTAYRALLWAHHYEKFDFLGVKDKEFIGKTREKYQFEELRGQVNETMNRFDNFVPMLQQYVKKENNNETFTDKLDAYLTHRVIGPLVFFSIMFLIFQAMFTWAAPFQDAIENIFGSLSEMTKAALGDGWASSLVADGIIAGLAGIVVFVPQIALLFLILTLLEEVGYMARAVFMFDRLLQRFGLNGRSLVSLVSGGACAIPAIMSARTIANPRERLITILVTPMISCSARIPVYTALVAFAVPNETVLGAFNMQGLAFMGLYLLGIGGALIAAWVFKKILKTQSPSFLMLELPPYRTPYWKNVGINIWAKTSAFVVGAGKIIFVISIILWFLSSFGPGDAMQQAEQKAHSQAIASQLDTTATADLVAAQRLEHSYAGYLGKAFEPVIRPLGFDWKIGIALITSFAAREVFVGTMSTIYAIGSSGDDTEKLQQQMASEKHPDGRPVFTPAVSWSLLFFYVFALQCMSTVAATKRETQSWKWAFVQFAFMTTLAYLGSLSIYQIWG